VKAAQIAAGIALGAGAAYSLYAGYTKLVVFFTSLFVVALLAPGLISRMTEVSLGAFRASFKDRIDAMPHLGEEEKRELKSRIDGAGSLDEALDVLVSSAGEHVDRSE